MLHQSLDTAFDVQAAADVTQPICPPHPGLMLGMCVRCGASVDEQEETAIPLKSVLVHSSKFAMMQHIAALYTHVDQALCVIRYLHMGLQVSAQEAERIRYNKHS